MIKLLTTLTLFLFITSCSFELDKSKEIKLKGLSSPVNVYYDNYGIPHIEAQNEKDAAYALGFTMASDRLFQMDLLRRIGNGQLSEIFGEQMLSKDILLRKLGLRRAANKNWAKVLKNGDPKMISEMKAFYDGVNEFVKTGPMPLEVKLLRYEIKPFVPEEALAVAGYMSLSFAQGLLSDPLYHDFSKKFSKEEMTLLFSNHSNYEKSKVSYTPSSDFFKSLNKDLEKLTKDLFMFHGSNAFVLSGERSISGKPILENDPHIAVSNPSIWYEAHVKTPSFELYGHYIPLSYLPGLGHSKHKAWGITMAEMDDLDLYVETFNKDNPDLVLYKNKYVPVIKHREEIIIKGEETHIETVIETPHGPILDDVEYVLGKKAIALKWSYLHPDNDIASALYKLSRIKKLDELAGALSHAASPAFAVSFADSLGNIGVHYMGKFPKRAKGTSGKTLMRGDDGSHEYLGYKSIQENPHVYNPSSGVLVNANQYPDQPGDWQGYWQYHGRHQSIHNFLKLKKNWSLRGLKEITTQEESFQSKEVFKIILPLIEAKTNIEKNALSLLKKWDHSTDLKSNAAAIYYYYYGEVFRTLLKDEIETSQLESYARLASSVYFLDNVYRAPKSALWDDKSTQKIESMKDTINIAFQNTIKELTKRLGNHIEDWQWGDLHHITFNHPMGRVFPLDKLLNLGPYSVGGANSNVNNMSYNMAKTEFDVSVGPSTRRLIDMSAPNNSLGILPSGNSGHRFSKHHSDQVGLFLSNEFRPQIMDIEQVKQMDHSLMKLIPRK